MESFVQLRWRDCYRICRARAGESWVIAKMFHRMAEATSIPRITYLHLPKPPARACWLVGWQAGSPHAIMLQRSGNRVPMASQVRGWGTFLALLTDEGLRFQGEQISLAPQLAGRSRYFDAPQPQRWGSHGKTVSLVAACS